MKTLTLLPRTSNTGKKKYLSRHVQPQMNWNHICSEEEWRIVNRSSDVGAWASEQLDFPWTDFPTVCWEWKDHLDQIPVRKCTWVFNEILRLPRHFCLFRVLWGRTPLFQFNYFLQVVGFFFLCSHCKNNPHTHTHSYSHVYDTSMTIMGRGFKRTQRRIECTPGERFVQNRSKNENTLWAGEGWMYKMATWKWQQSHGCHFWRDILYSIVQQWRSGVFCEAWGPQKVEQWE